MTLWLGDALLGAFAVRVLEKIGAVERDAAIAALRRGLAVATPPVQGDINEALRRLGSPGFSRSRQGVDPGRPRSRSTDIPVGRGGRGLALTLTKAFMAGDLDLRRRSGAPKPGWEGMPEFRGAKELRAAGATDAEVRLWLTFTAAMDRARDADVMADASLGMWRSDPWAFDPDRIVARSERDLADLLRARKVSQKHSQDAPAWRRIAQSLGHDGQTPAVRRAVYEGTGDARELHRAVAVRDRDREALFPLLRGPKIARLWIRELVYPGRATFANLDVIEVAVDVQVRKVTEYLGVTDTGDFDLSVAREVIQRVWKADVEASGAAGPEAIQNTSAALDPALWFFAKWGCTPCQEVGERIQISPICAECRFPLRS